MKHNTNKLDLTQPLEYVTYIDGQDTPITITGSNELLLDIAASDAPRLAAMEKADKVARKAGKRAVGQYEAPQDTFKSRLHANIRARVFDRLHNTNLYDQLQEKRENERIVKMGVELGLISLTDTVCQRHAHAVDQLRG